MRPFQKFAVVLLIAGAVSVAAAQQTTTTAPTKISNVADYATTMKMLGGALGAVNKAIGSNAFGDAKTQLTTARQGLTAVQTFWEAQQKADLTQMAKDALAKVDALDKTLSASAVDQTAALAGFKELAGACGACHKQYRDQDPTTKAS